VKVMVRGVRARMVSRWNKAHGMNNTDRSLPANEIQVPPSYMRRDTIDTKKLKSILTASREDCVSSTGKAQTYVC